MRVALGEPGGGHADVLSSTAVLAGQVRDQFGQHREREGPGFYAAVTHDWPPRPAPGCDSARRVLDRTGRMPHGQLLLRPRPPDLHERIELDDEFTSDKLVNEDEFDEVTNAEGAPGVAVDAAAAASLFTAIERSNVLQPLLTKKQSADAIAWTTKVHGSVSGVSATELRAAVANYVDPAAIAAAIAAHNQANPTRAIEPGTAPS